MRTPFLNKFKTSITSSVLLSLAGLACVQSVESPSSWPGGVHTDCLNYFDGVTGYIPKDPSDLTALPAHIRDTVIKHIRDRVGDEFFRKLRFEGGEVIDIDELHRVQPETKDYQWSPPAYNLHFHISLPDEGVERFCAQIELDRSGNVIQELTLPKISADPTKGNIVPRRDAEIEARKQGVEVESAFVQLAYYPSLDSMVWLFSHGTRNEGSRFWGETCYINAHTGCFIRWSFYEGIS